MASNRNRPPACRSGWCERLGRICVRSSDRVEIRPRNIRCRCSPWTKYHRGGLSIQRSHPGSFSLGISSLYEVSIAVSMRTDPLMQRRQSRRTQPRSVVGHYPGLAAILLATSACQSLQLPPRNLVSTDGGYATLLRGPSSHLKISTVSVLPGPESSEYPNRSIECGRSSIATRVLWADGTLSAMQASRLCDAAARSAGLPLQANGQERTPVRYQLTIVSDGGGIWRQLPGPERPGQVVSFWFPSSPDADSLRRRVIATTAHEFQHIATALSGQPRRSGQREPDAYLAGACAQLLIEGTLARANLPDGHDPRADPFLPSAAKRSAHAGSTTGAALLRFFGDADTLHINEGGRHLVQHCHETISFPLQQ